MWAKRCAQRGAPWTVDALSRKLSLPGIAVADMACNLERAGLLAQADDGTLFPARELKGITADADHPDRAFRQQRACSPDACRRARCGTHCTRNWRRSWREACGERTLADLIELADRR